MVWITIATLLRLADVCHQNTGTEVYCPIASIHPHLLRELRLLTSYFVVASRGSCAIFGGSG